MIFTIGNLMDSLAAILKSEYPNYRVYIGPNQQGTSLPCFFLFLMPSTIEDHVDERYYRDLGIDVVFVQQRNTANGNAQLQEVQEFLDSSLDLIPYSDGSGTVLLHTYEREASTEDQELHYKFHIRERLYIPKKENPMMELEENNARIKEN